MQALWIKLGCTLDEMQGKGTKESVKSASKHLFYTYLFTAIVTVASTACAVYLITWISLLYARGTDNPETVTNWL